MTGESSSGAWRIALLVVRVVLCLAALATLTVLAVIGARDLLGSDAVGQMTSAEAVVMLGLFAASALSIWLFAHALRTYRN